MDQPQADFNVRIQVMQALCRDLGITPSYNVKTSINYYDIMKLLSDIEDHEHPTNQVSIIEEDF